MSNSLEKINSSLQHRIATQIKQKGAISFAEFMQMALYEPGLGYYSAGLHKLGAGGDFVTSPELGPLFAQTHAHCFAEVLPQLADPVIFELGAGSGQFCVDVLLQLEHLGCLPDAYWILEVSADFKQVQAEKIAMLPAHLVKRVRWLDEAPGTAFQGIVFANEVLDALPVEVFRYTEAGYARLMLENSESVLNETWQPFPPELLVQLEQKELQLAPGYRSEFIPYLTPWLESITGALTRGLVLMVDYGFGRPAFYHPQRHQGTVVCHRRHAANFNPYQHVGLQDITAFVDFTAVAESMQQVGLEVTGFTTQADFLIHSGIDQLLDAGAEYQNYYQQVAEMKQLVLPDEMGEKFKVIAAQKGLQIDLAGFRQNHWQLL